MLELYMTENADIYGELNKILSRHVASPFEILKSVNGKPYIGGNPVFFSVSHSRKKGFIAVCDKPVGVDIEVISKRNYKSVLSRFPADEAKEISDDGEFLKHWVVREAYVKMLGATLAGKLKGLKFADGILFDNGKPADCTVTFGQTDGCVYCVCIDNNGGF